MLAGENKLGFYFYRPDTLGVWGWIHQKAGNHKPDRLLLWVSSVACRSLATKPPPLHLHPSSCLAGPYAALPPSLATLSIEYTSCTGHIRHSIIAGSLFLWNLQDLNTISSRTIACAHVHTRARFLGVSRNTLASIRSLEKSDTEETIGSPKSSHKQISWF